MSPLSSKANLTSGKLREAPKVESKSTVKKGNKLVVIGKPSNVAEYLLVQINASGKSQALIAEEVGFAMPNMITMLKKNLSKLPIDKIGKMAASLSIDPVHLYTMCMKEYYPDTWAGIQSFLKTPTLTENELEIIKVIRESNVVNPKLKSEADKVRLLEFANTLFDTAPTE